MKAPVIYFLASRYLWRRREGGLTSSLLSLIGIFVGVLTLNVVVGVMNGFQMGFIETVLEVSSSHLRIQMPPNRELSAQALWEISQDPRVRSITAFMDSQTLIHSNYGNTRGAFVRGVPASVIFDDPAIGRKLKIVDGAWDLSGGEKIIIGSELARNLMVRVGDRISLMALGGPNFSLLRPKEVYFQVTAIFRTDFYEIDLGWAFVNLEQVRDFFETELELLYSVKLNNYFDDQAVLQRITSIVEKEEAKVVSWRDYNRAFFGALRMEKLVMMVLIALIFPVVWMNIQHSLKRTIRERREDLGILKALGASHHPIRVVFLSEGAVIGFLGSFWGTLFGLLILVNINSIILWIEQLLSFLSGLMMRLSGQTFDTSSSLIFGGVFYMSEVPYRILWHEVWIIFLIGFLSSAASAWRSSVDILNIQTREVLRNE
jgi:lipoprotein-releasing system permease protein